MKLLRLYNIALTLIGATMALLLAVVCLLYAVHIDASPKMREEWPALVAATLMFGALALASAVAWQGLRKNAAWQWPAQAVLLAVLGFIGWTVQARLFA